MSPDRRLRTFPPDVSQVTELTTFDVPVGLYDGIHVELQRAGWVDAEWKPVRTVYEGGRGYFSTYASVQRLEAVHSLGQGLGRCPEVVSLFRSIAYCHPRKRVGIVPPSHQVPAHQDFVKIQGTPNTVTVVTPVSTGPLHLRVARQAFGSVLPMVPVGPVGGQCVVPDVRWQSVTLTRGDVLLLGSLVVHEVIANDGDRLETYWEGYFQSPDETICDASLFPHHYPRVPGWRETTRGWGSRRWVRGLPKRRQRSFVMPRSLDTWHETLNATYGFGS